MQQQQFSTL